MGRARSVHPILALSEELHCKRCARCYKRKALVTNASAHEMDPFLKHCGLVFPNLVERYTAAMKGKGKGRGKVSFSVVLFYRPKCAAKRFRFGFVPSTGDYVEVADYP